MSISRRKLWRYAAAPLAVNVSTPAQARTSAAPGAAELAEMIAGVRWSQMLSVVARLGIADRLAEGPKTIQQLAQETNSHADSLYRVLRALAGRGVFVEENGQRFRLTPAAEPLRSNVPGSLRRTAQIVSEDWWWNAWGALAHTVATGETAFNHVYGKNTWDWFAEHPRQGSLFNAFQSEGTLASTADVLKSYDFSPFPVIADIGGGEGTLLSSILQAHPSARGILFDLPHTIADARKRLTPAGKARIQFVPGDFFRSVPSGANLYILKYIIHDWDSESAVKILAACRKAMAPNATLLLVDSVICAPNQPCESKPADVLMMVRTGGRNRTEEEYRALLSKAGFDLVKVASTAWALGLLTAVPRGR